jgi:hypothetical protein
MNWGYSARVQVPGIALCSMGHGEQMYSGQYNCTLGNCTRLLSSVEKDAVATSGSDCTNQVADEVVFLRIRSLKSKSIDTIKC